MLLLSFLTIQNLVRPSLVCWLLAEERRLCALKKKKAAES
jgi:hypothetical protein